MMDKKDDFSSLVEDGIRAERTKTILAGLMVLGLIGFAISLGLSLSPYVGAGIIFPGLWAIWKYYSG